MLRHSISRASGGLASRFRFRRLGVHSVPVRNITRKVSSETIKYSRVMRSMGQFKRYYLDTPADALPIDENHFIAEVKRLINQSESKQVLTLLLLWSKHNSLPIRLDHCLELLRICLESKDAATARQLITANGAHATNPKVLRVALKVFAASGASAYAQDVIYVLSNSGLAVTWNNYVCVLHAAASAGALADFLSVKEEMRRQGFRPSRIVYNLALKAGLKSRNHLKTISIYEEMCECKIAPDKYTWGIVLQSYVSEGDIDGAENLLSDIIDRYPASLSPHHFNILMKAYSDANNNQACYDMLDRMKALSQSKIKGAKLVDAYSYSICMAAAAKAENKERIVSLAKEMCMSGFQFNHATWRTVTAPFGKTLDAAGLRSFIGSMVYIVIIVIVNYMVYPYSLICR